MDTRPAFGGGQCGAPARGMARRPGLVSNLQVRRIGPMIRLRTILASILVFAASPAPSLVAQDHDHAAATGPAAAPHSMNNKDLPADEPGVKTRLSTSSRHGEWVKINTPSGP